MTSLNVQSLIQGEEDEYLEDDSLDMDCGEYDVDDQASNGSIN